MNELSWAQLQIVLNALMNMSAQYAKVRAEFWHDKNMQQYITCKQNEIEEITKLLMGYDR